MRTFKRCVAAIVLAVGILATPLRAAPPQMRAHFIDIGQGACTLLEFPEGAILMDTGAQDDAHVDKLVEYLQDFFDRRTDLSNTLSLVIISHPHIDHTRGLRDVVENFRVLGYVENGNEGRRPGNVNPKWLRANPGRIAIRPVMDSDITDLPQRTGLTDDIIDPIDGDTVDPRIVILSGGLDENPGWPDGDFENENNHSLAVRVDFGDSSFLFTGDMETKAQETLAEYYDGTNLLDVDVWQVSHHGSYNGTTEELLAAMTPEYAMIGVGKASFGAGERRGFTTFAYGHPRRVVMELLSSAIPGSRFPAIVAPVADSARFFSDYEVEKNIYATGWEGTIVLTADSQGAMSVESDLTEPSPLNVAGLPRPPRRFTRLETMESGSDGAAGFVPFGGARRPRTQGRVAAPSETGPQEEKPAITTGYRVVQAANPIILEEKVNELLHDGWQPLGGLTSYATSDGPSVLVQAMIKNN